jgi:hypothetical protein
MKHPQTYKSYAQYIFIPCSVIISAALASVTLSSDAYFPIVQHKKDGIKVDILGTKADICEKNDVHDLILRLLGR